MGGATARFAERWGGDPSQTRGDPRHAGSWGSDRSKPTKTGGTTPKSAIWRLAGVRERWTFEARHPHPVTGVPLRAVRAITLMPRPRGWPAPPSGTCLKGPNTGFGPSGRSTSRNFGVVSQDGGADCAGFVRTRARRTSGEFGRSLPTTACCAGQAARSYSWMTPPRMSRRMTVLSVPDGSGRGNGCSSPRPRCGRASL
jgi:hypothetical protein